MDINLLIQAYTGAVTALQRTGIISQLPGSADEGVVGLDGTAYLAPTPAEVQDLLVRSQALVDLKMSQGFTQLQVTPLAMPVATLLERVSSVLRRHAVVGTLYRTQHRPGDAVVPMRLNTAAPLWVWERVRRTLDTPQMVYFPQAYSLNDHHGYTKQAAIHDASFCAVPGWSVALIEPLPIMPQPGRGQVIGGRKQLETQASPREYLQSLADPSYQGETGWTPEDFLTHFILQLETTHQVSHDRFDANALWLLGTYLPDVQPTPHLVPVGYCASELGRKLYLTAHRTGNHLKPCGARTIVRLAMIKAISGYT